MHERTTGVLAPFALLIVVVMLWLFRFIYGEAMTALPMK
jgi:hypothetical protein